FLLPVEHDPLRDDAVEYLKKLQQHNIKCDLHMGDGLVHGCLRAINIRPGVMLLLQKIVGKCKKWEMD
ncbi:MAG: alpha/beta hydrolase, partial [Alphaproteobacteria bacterium]|nr:alpha/beta hydrolase [Alphaproteobacteria bacterium]